MMNLRVFLRVKVLLTVLQLTDNDSEKEEKEIPSAVVEDLRLAEIR